MSEVVSLLFFLFFFCYVWELGFYISRIIYKKAFKSRVSDLFSTYSEPEWLNKKEPKVKIISIYLSVESLTSIEESGDPHIPFTATPLHILLAQVRWVSPVVILGEHHQM